MADEVPAAHGVEAAQAVIQDDAQANQQLQVLSFALVCAGFACHSFPFILPVRMFACLPVVYLGLLLSRCFS